MTEQKQHRSVDEIQREYSGACTRAGHIQYQMSQLKKDLDITNNTLQDLNFEAAASARAAKEAEESAKAELPAPEQSAQQPEVQSNG